MENTQKLHGKLTRALEKKHVDISVYDPKESRRLLVK